MTETISDEEYKKMALDRGIVRLLRGAGATVAFGLIQFLVSISGNVPTNYGQIAEVGFGISILLAIDKYLRTKGYY